MNKIIKTKEWLIENSLFIAIPALWIFMGLAYFMYMLFLWGNQSTDFFLDNKNLVSSFSYFIVLLAPIVTPIIGTFLLLKKQQTKKTWLAGLLGISILVPFSIHLFDSLFIDQIELPTALGNTFLYLSLGGLVPFVTLGIIFPGLLPWVGLYLYWQFFKYDPNNLYRTAIVFISFALLWEITLITGLALSYG